MRTPMEVRPTFDFGIDRIRSRRWIGARNSIASIATVATGTFGAAGGDDAGGDVHLAQHPAAEVWPLALMSPGPGCPQDGLPALKSFIGHPLRRGCAARRFVMAARIAVNTRVISTGTDQQVSPMPRAVAMIRWRGFVRAPSDQNDGDSGDHDEAGPAAGRYARSGASSNQAGSGLDLARHGFLWSPEVGLSRQSSGDTRSRVATIAVVLRGKGGAGRDDRRRRHADEAVRHLGEKQIGALPVIDGGHRRHHLGARRDLLPSPPRRRGARLAGHSGNELARHHRRSRNGCAGALAMMTHAGSGTCGGQR